MRGEYPRPDFVRKEWLSLNGRWDFSWGAEQAEIEVPFVCQSELSGIGIRIKDSMVIYRRKFIVPEAWRGRSVLLRFGAVDYRCDVFVNGSRVGSHAGGQTPFFFDITDYLTWGEETVVVKAEDPVEDEMIARGKQFWEDKSRFIWYTPSTGIWQSVWLEPVEKTSLSWVRFTPDIDEGTVKIDFRLAETSQLPCTVYMNIRFGEEEVFQGSMVCGRLQCSITVDVFRKKAMEGSFHFTGNYWSPENPLLYDVNMWVEDGNGAETDRIASYFGMRKIHVENGRLYLNNQPYYHKLVLDQGYWKEGLVTAPSDQAYVGDILKCKAMGFNGCRKHEKVEDPRFLYWADRLGFLVWESMASFWSYTPQAASAFLKEWTDVIDRDYNHPCIVVWGMLNESWGVPRIYDNPQQQAFARSLYYMAKAFDGTRLVISNDGWEMVDTDICAIHSYKHGEKDDYAQHQRFAQALKQVERFTELSERLPFARGFVYEKQPVVLTECGGIALKTDHAERSGKDVHREKGEEWGYTSVAGEDFLTEYDRIVTAIYEADIMNGFCYTQLTDIEQETNGLLTRDHQYKFAPEIIKKINDKKS